MACSEAEERLCLIFKPLKSKSDRQSEPILLEMAEANEIMNAQW